MTFLFYDLETSGRSSKWQRIMQFGAQRTDENLKPIDEPIEHLVSMSEEILPEPGAILLTGITPQVAKRDGMNEAEFWREVEPIFREGNTCILGYNSIRFDDEFIRYSLWRNLRDPYAWSWENGNSRWDLLDLVRMVRALRPDGLEWPVDSEGGVTNRLEDLARVNNLSHDKAHTALSDVNATIELARLIKSAQPKLWDWLLGLRSKKPLQAFVEAQANDPFIYTSGSIPKEYQHTSLVVQLAPTPRGDGVWVYDLRVDPDEWLGRNDDELKEALENRERLPVKQLKFNRAPAVAPRSVLDDKSQTRLALDRGVIEKNRKKLKGKDIGDFLRRTSELNEARFAAKEIDDPDGQLYEGFLSDKDRAACRKVISLGQEELSNHKPEFQDTRLGKLFLLYKARNFPAALSEQEREEWEKYKLDRLQAPYGVSLERYYEELKKYSESADISEKQKDLITELDLYAQSIMPEPA